MKKFLLLALCASLPAVCQSIVAGKDDTQTVRIVRTDNQGQVYIANPGGGGSTTISGGQTNNGDVAPTSVVTVAGSDGTDTRTMLTSINGVIATVSANTPSDGKANTAGILSSGGFTGQPLQVFPFLFNGSTWDRPYVCATSAVVNVTNGTTGQLVALTAAQTIRVCSMVLTSTAATTATLSYGTGTTCGTGNAALTGAMALGASTSPLAITLGPESALRTASGNALCLAAGATAVTGFITYAKY